MSSSSLTPSYAAVLRTRYACRTFGAALLGRLSYGMLSRSGVLAVKKATNSYAAAGTVMALLWMTSVFLSPTRAALIDRYGVRRVLPPLATAYASLLAGLAFATSRGGTPVVLLGGLAVLAGATTPPLGPVMRTLWRRMVPDRRLLQHAYSLDAVAEELLLVIGPLLVGLLTRITAPSVGLATSAALVLTGSLALAASPPVSGEKAPAKSSVASEESVPGPRLPSWRRPALRGGPGLRQAITVSAGMGMCLGSLELLVIAFFDDHHRPGAVSWALAALSVGSAIGGLFVAPALTTAYLIADESVSPAARTQAGAWVNTAFNAGSAGATAAAGWLVDRLPLSLCFALAAAPAVLSAATVLDRSHRSVAGAARSGAEGASA